MLSGASDASNSDALLAPGDGSLDSHGSDSFSNNSTVNDLTSDFFHEAEPRSDLIEFTCFPRLPTELRDIIWTLACFQPRVIDIWLKELAANVRKGSAVAAFANAPTRHDRYPFYYLSHQITPPAVLQTCKESRAIGLKYYSLSFDTSQVMKEGLGTITVATPPRIYVNRACDIIFPIPGRIGDHKYELYECLIMGLKSDRLKIRRIAIPPDWLRFIYNMMEVRSIEEIIFYDSEKHPRDRPFHRHAPFELTLSSFTKVEDEIGGDDKRAQEASEERQQLIQDQHHLEKSLINMGIYQEKWLRKHLKDFPS